MVNTITIKDLTGDAGKDVREAWERGEVEIWTNWTILGSNQKRITKFLHEDLHGDWHVPIGDNNQGLSWMKEDTTVQVREVVTPTPDPLALAEAALRPFADGYRAYMESRAARSRRDIRDWIYFNADDELLEQHYKQAADALEAIRQARGE